MTLAGRPARSTCASSIRAAAAARSDLAHLAQRTCLSSTILASAEVLLDGYPFVEGQFAVMEGRQSSPYGRTAFADS